MDHLKKFRKLNRTTAHRSALYRNMCEALFKYGRIKTTVIKAKEITVTFDQPLTLQIDGEAIANVSSYHVKCAD